MIKTTDFERLATQVDDLAGVFSRALSDYARGATEADEVEDAAGQLASLCMHIADLLPSSSGEGAA